MINIKGDCRLISVSKMLNIYGIELSPQMCFGIGEGYDFNYEIDKTAKVPLLLVLGRKLSAEIKLLQNLKIEYEDSNTFGKANLNFLLNKKAPILINVDRFYLDYLKDLYGNSHCGLHSVLLYDFYQNNGKNEVEIYEPLKNNYFLINKIELEKARNIENISFAPCGYWLNLKISDTKIDIDKLNYLHIIRKNFETYADKEKGGLLQFQRFIKNIEEVLDGIEGNLKIFSLMKVQISFLGKYIREFENTQSFYRELYADFLEEIEKKYSYGLFNSIIYDFKVLSQKWYSLGQNIEKGCMNFSIDMIQFIINSLYELKNEEEKITTKMLGITNFQSLCI